MTTTDLMGCSYGKSYTFTNPYNQFENNRYILIVLFVLIGIVVLLVVLSFLNKGPKTVYLKPKNSNSNQNTVA